MSSILWMVVVVTMNKPSRVFQVFVSPKELCQLNEKHFLQPFEATSCAFYILLSMELELCYPFSWHYDIYPGKNIWFISIYQKTSSFTMLINIQIYEHRIFQNPAKRFKNFFYKNLFLYLSKKVTFKIASDCYALIDLCVFLFEVL